MNEEILKQLKDVHLPLKPGLWPLAPGYYILAFLLAILISLAVFILLRFLKKLRIRRELEAELLKIKSRFESDRDLAFLQNRLNWLIRKVATKIVSSTSSAQILDLEKAVKISFKDQQKAEQLLRLLEKDRFRPEKNLDGDELINLSLELSKKWRI